MIEKNMETVNLLVVLLLLSLVLLIQNCDAAATTTTTTTATSSDIGFQRNLSSRNSYAELSDIWLCLACALGWAIWLVNTRQSLLKTELESTIFDQEESTRVVGNVLSVSVGQDADGTGIPVYLALIDYVVECYDPTETIAFVNNTDYKDGVVKDQPIKGEPVQIRKCFHTNRWLESGFANVQVLVLVRDPTSSMLYDDYVREKRERKDPVDIFWVVGAHIMAATLIFTSLYGAYAAIPKLVEEEQEIGWITLIVGAILLYPLAIVLYHSMAMLFRWMSERKGVIINGAKDWQCTRVACGIGNALEGFDDGEEVIDSKVGSPKTSSSSSKPNDSQRLELPVLHSAKSSDKREYRPPARPYPNAGCAYKNYTVDLGEGGGDVSVNSSTLSSISSNATPRIGVNSGDTNTCMSSQIGMMSCTNNNSHYS